MKLLSYGEILWDLIEGKHYLGGAPFNFAAHSAKCGVETWMISRLGKDDPGHQALEKMKELRVSTDFVQWDTSHPTGTVTVFLKNGQPSYTIHPEVAYDFINYDELVGNGLLKQQFDMFGFGTLAQRNESSRETLHRILKNMQFEHVFYDVNLRKDCFTPEIIRASIKFSTIFKLNDEEVPVISAFLYGEKLDDETFCQKVSADTNQQIIIITAGGDGCRVYHEGQLHKVSGKKVKVVDTVGAGDSFSASFLYAFFKWNDPVRAAEAANQVGGFVASSHGPLPDYSSELKEMLEID